VDFILSPGQQKTIRFLLAWHSPEWESDFPYGLKLHRYTNMYTQHYPSALAAAQKLAENHESLLRRVLAWQQVVYAEKDFPLWLRDQLVNMLHLITEMSFWAVAKPPLGDWCYQGGLFSLVESTVADGQQTCIPCDWYGNFPLVYFFPDLVWSTLRALRVKMRADGAVPFILGRGLDLAGGPSEDNYDHDRQESQNGACYADMVGRLWLVTGKDEVLREFYPSVKQNLIYTMNRHPEPDNVLGVVTPGNEWYEGFNMRGITAHAGGTRLAQIRIVEQMAERMGDKAFAEQCRDWFAQGSQRLEEKLWDGEGYLLSLDTATGRKNDLVLAFQLDGDWMAGLHGLPNVFPPERAKATLATIKRLNAAAAGPRGITLTVIQRDGRLNTFGGRMGWNSSMPASVFILAMNYLYAGERETGLDIAYRSINHLVNILGFSWDMPNMVRSDPATDPLPEYLRIYGSDYYQGMSLWAMPTALRGENLKQAAAPGGLIARILQAARKS
jgi:non-lysosomal glucosylceramidase